MPASTAWVWAAEMSMGRITRSPRSSVQTSIGVPGAVFVDAVDTVPLRAVPSGATQSATTDRCIESSVTAASGSWAKRDVPEAARTTTAGVRRRCSCCARTVRRRESSVSAPAFQPSTGAAISISSSAVSATQAS